MSAPFPPPRTATLGPRQDVVQALRAMKPGDPLLFTWPAGAPAGPVEREAGRRRVHSAGHAVFGPGQYTCRTLDRGIEVERRAATQRSDGPLPSGRRT